MIRHRFEDPSETDEQHALGELKQTVAKLDEHQRVMPQTYWANLLVRANARVDDATSARALSISWAARVAIPGVVAIMFFFIGLHYYVPEAPSRTGSIATFVNMLPEATVDSVLVEPDRYSTLLSEEEVATDIFQFSSDQISDYLVASGNTQMAVEGITDSDIAALLSILNSKKDL